MAKGALSRQPAPSYIFRGAQGEEHLRREESGKRPEDARQTFPTHAFEHTCVVKLVDLTAGRNGFDGSDCILLLLSRDASVCD